MLNCRKIMLVCLGLFLIIGSYNIGESKGNNSVKEIKDISPEQWSKLEKQKIYFGHQSVGNNMLDGIRAVMAEHPGIKLNIVETRDLASVGVGVLAHSKVGKNEDPVSKTNDFVEIMDAGLGGKTDIAFHKYCYIDANGTTDVKKVFSNYREQINYLQLKYPATSFIHITMPLTTVQTGPKALIKKMLGKPVGGVDANMKRNEFNKLLIDTYKGNAPVFDLAKIEATRPDGTETTFKKDGVEYLSMFEDYTNDGGHLNKLGQKAIAEKFLIFLIQVK